jgi:clathrin heavy chain
MVTETSKFSDQTSPRKIFDCHPTLAGAQIINYRVTSDEKMACSHRYIWKFHRPICIQNQGLYATLQSASFAEIKLDDHQKPTKLFTFAIRTATGAKVYYLYH